MGTCCAAAVAAVLASAAGWTGAPPPGDAGTSSEGGAEGAGDADGAVGECVTMHDCAGGALGDCDNNLPGGYCYVFCGTERCPYGNVCVPEGVCVRASESDADCRADEGYPCQTWDGIAGRVCVAP